MQSFLRSPNKYQDGVKVGSHAPEETFLRTYEIGKERTSFEVAPDQLVPRTIADEKLLSHVDEITRPPNETSQLNSFLRDSIEKVNSKLEATADEAMAPATIPKALPPHLRVKNLPPSNSEKTDPAKHAPAAKDGPSHEANKIKDANQAAWLANLKKEDSGLGALPDDTNGSDIREKSAYHGVKVNDAKPLVTYPSSEEQEEAPSQPTKQEFRGRGRSRGRVEGFRGRGEGFRGRPSRASRWPTKSEFPKPDNHRFDIDWEKTVCSSDINSVQADAGFGNHKKKKRTPGGIDVETGFQLTDWSGSWAPVSFCDMHLSCVV